MFALLRKHKNEDGMRSALEANPSLADLIKEEIAHHEPMCDRDHSCRSYVAMLNRVLKTGAADPHAEHDRKMKDALAAAKAKPDG